MVKRSLSVLMALVLMLAMIPTAFAEDSGQAGAEGAAGTAGTENEGPAEEAEESIGNSDITDFENVNFPIQNNDTGKSSSEAEGTKDGEDPSDGKDDDQKTIEPELKVSTGVGYTVIDDEHYYSVGVGASVPGSAVGKFEIFLDGREPGELDWEDGQNGLQASASFEVEKPGTYNALVRFQGEVDGKKVTLEAEKTVKFPSEDFRFEVTYDGKRTFGGKLLGAKDAKGTWFIGVYDHHKEDWLLEEHWSDSIASLEYSHPFKDLKPGTYDVMVTFGGVVDGVEAGATGIVSRVTIKEDGSGEIPNPDKDKTPVVTDPDKGEKIIENAKGGKLPETATNHPNFALLGGLMFLSGWVLLKFRTIKG